MRQLIFKKLIYLVLITGCTLILILHSIIYGLVEPDDIDYAFQYMNEEYRNKFA